MTTNNYKIHNQINCVDMLDEVIELLAVISLGYRGRISDLLDEVDKSGLEMLCIKTEGKVRAIRDYIINKDNPITF
jgi:hypothetical protein